MSLRLGMSFQYSGIACRYNLALKAWIMLPCSNAILTRRLWLQPRFLCVLLALTSTLLLFSGVAEEVGKGETRATDTAILLALHPADPDSSLDPRWLQEAARDITALGSSVVLGLIVLSTCGFLLVARRYREAIWVLVAPALGVVIISLLKLHFDRQRPDVIPHGIDVSGASFPSAHAMLSTIVYLTLASVLASSAVRSRLKLYVLCIAVLLSVLVGLSRIYLGVHWPSDVMAGWAAGTGWAVAAWAVAEAMNTDGMIR
jgi:undecaprenyl-diphosphatase